MRTLPGAATPIRAQTDRHRGEDGGRVRRREAAPTREASTPFTAAPGSSRSLLATPFEPASTTSEPAHTAAGLPQPALAALLGARGLGPLVAFSDGRGVIHIAGGSLRIRGLASPTPALAVSHCVKTAPVVRPVRRCQLAPDRFPWQTAPQEQRCERPRGLRGTSHPQVGVARICTTTWVNATPTFFIRRPSLSQAERFEQRAARKVAWFAATPWCSLAWAAGGSSTLSEAGARPSTGTARGTTTGDARSPTPGVPA